MRKKYLLILLLLGVFWGSYWLSLEHQEQSLVLQKPTETGSEGSEDHKGREQYFNLIFGGDEETSYDWKSNYEKVRRDEAELRNTRRARIVRSNQPISRIESFANGAIEGTWKERGAKNQAGRILTAEVLEDSNIVYIGTDGGSVMRGTLPNGNDYTILNNNMQFEVIKLYSFVINGTKRVVVIDKNGVYYSDNDGVTWTKSYDGVPRTATMSRSDNSITFVAYRGNVYQSTDFGESFNKIGSVPDNSKKKYAIWTPRYVKGPLYAVSEVDVYKFEGGTQMKVGSLPSGELPIKMDGDDSKNNSTLFVKANENLYKSTDGGVTWSGGIAWDNDANPPKSIKMFGYNSFCATTEDILYGGSLESYISKDAGGSWKKLNKWGEYYGAPFKGDPKTKLHADLDGAESFKDKDGTLFTLLSTDGGTFITYDDSNFTNITLTNIRNNMYYGATSRWDDPDIILAGSQDQGAQISRPENGTDIMDFMQYISGDQGSYTSSDSGKSTWLTYIRGSLYYHPDTRDSTYYSAHQPNKSDDYIWMAPTVADPSNPKICYTGGTKVYETTYNGPKDFTHLEHSSKAFGDKITAMAISTIDNNYWYVVTKEKILYTSTDYGHTWSSKSSFPLGYALVGQCVLPDNQDIKTLYVSGNGNGNPAVLISTDEGQTLSALGNNTPTTAVHKMIQSDNGKFIFAAGYDAAYVYVKDDNTWYNMTGNYGPDVKYFDLEYIPTIKTIRFVTHGRGIWDFVLDTPLTPIDTTNFSKNFVQIGRWDATGDNTLVDSSQIASDTTVTGTIVTTATDTISPKITVVVDGAYDTVDYIKITIKNDAPIRLVLNESSLSDQEAPYYVTIPSTNGVFKEFLFNITDFMQTDGIDDSNKHALNLANVQSISFENDNKDITSHIYIKDLRLNNFKEGAVAINKKKQAVPTVTITGVQNSNLHISLAKEGEYHMKLYSLNGKLIINKKIYLKAGQQSVSLRGVASSISIISISGNGYYFSKKISIK